MPNLPVISGGPFTKSSAAGTSALGLSFTAASTANSSALALYDALPISLAGGTIKDAATNNATLTLPTVGGASSIGDQKTTRLNSNHPAASFTTPCVKGNTYNAAS